MKINGMVMMNKIGMRMRMKMKKIGMKMILMMRKMN